jgi:hypothetical protein
MGQHPSARCLLIGHHDIPNVQEILNAAAKISIKMR